MFRSPQLLASPSLKGTHRSLCLLSRETLASACPRHQKLNGMGGRREVSHQFLEGSCCLKKEDTQNELPQNPTREEKIVLKETYSVQGSSDTCSPPAPDGPTRITCSHRLKLPMNTHFFCSVQQLSSRWLALPSHSHCQSNLLKYVINHETSCVSDLKCLLLHSHSQAGKPKGGDTTPYNIKSQQHSHSSVSFLSGSHKLLFPRSLVSTPKLYARSSLAGRLQEQHLAIQACGMHGAAQLKVSPEYCLSAENEARCRKSLEPNAALYQKDKGKSWAAVLVCLCTVGGEPAFLFTLRSSMLKGRHKGDVSFAGGKKDPADQDVVTTALREAREELGVTVRVDQVWGVLKPLRDMSGMLIAPVLANLGPLEAQSFRPNPSEVEEIFTLTLAHVCNPENRGYTNFRTGDRYGYTLPVFQNGKHRVWGLTAVALDHTLKLVVPP